MPLFGKEASDRPAVAHPLRGRLRALGGRLPGYLLLLAPLLRRRNLPVAYSQALAQEAGFGRLPVRVPGRMLPGFRGLGRVAMLGVLLHLVMRQRALEPKSRGHIASGINAGAFRDDAGTLLACARWAADGLRAKRSRLRP